MSTGMNNDIDSDWLKHSETLSEIKEESVEIKEEPFDDMADIKQEDLIYYPSDYVKDEMEDIKEETCEDFADLKQEESFLDAFNAIENESTDIKEEPNVDVKEEDFSTLPITDIFCPSTGDSRPLTIDLEEGMHSRSNTITVKEPGRFTRMLEKCEHCEFFYSIGTGMARHVRSRHPEYLEKFMQRFGQMKCDFCNCFYKRGHVMEKHVRSMHYEEFERSRSIIKCSFCDAPYKVGPEMENHLRSMHPEDLEKIRQQMILRKCQFCDALRKGGSEMNSHVQSMHSEELEKTRQRLQLIQCDFCDCFYKKGTVMEKHVRSKHPEEMERYTEGLCATSTAEISTPGSKRPLGGVTSSDASKRCRRQSKDEELAAVYGLPLSAAEIADMPVSDFQQLLKGDSLTEPQRVLMRKIHRKSERSKDDQHGLPISAAEIVDMPLVDLNQLVEAYSLTEQQRDLIRQIRRRGQINTASARAHRKRRADQTLD